MIAAIVGGVAGFVLLGLFIPESWTYLDSGSGPLVNDNMDRGDGPFVAESDSFVSLEYREGGYSMSLKAVENEDQVWNWQTARGLWGTEEPSVRISASFEVRDSSSDWMAGIGCVGPRGQYYLTIEEGSVAIAVEDLDQHTTNGLAFSEFDSPDAGRIELECVGGDGPTRLIGFVDGEEVVSARHSGGWESFRGMALTAAVPPSQSAEVMWDDPFAETL